MKILRTEKDVEALEESIKSHLTTIDDPEQMDKATGFMIQSIMGRQISMCDGLLKKKKEQLDGAIVKLKEELEGFNGSEVADTRVQRATAWVQQQEQQLEFLTSYLQADMEKAQAAYMAYFDKSWMPYSESRNIAAQKNQTAAKVEAEELLKKYTG